MRESLSLWLVLMVGAYGIYFFCNTINYFTVYKWSNIGHAPFKGQVGCPAPISGGARLWWPTTIWVRRSRCGLPLQTTAEISMASKAIPFMALLQVPVSLWEMHQYVRAAHAAAHLRVCLFWCVLAPVLTELTVMRAVGRGGAVSCRALLPQLQQAVRPGGAVLLG